MRQQPEKIDARFVKRFVRKRKRVFLSVFAVVFAASIVASFLAPRNYVSSAKFLIEGQMPDEILKGVSGGYIEERLQSITQQILSREKLVEIINKFGLYGNPKNEGDIERAVSTMKDNIAVRTIKADDLDKRPSRARLNTVAFTLSFEGKDPEVVQQVASQLASFYIQKNEQAKEQIAAQTTAVLQQRADQLKEQADLLGGKLNEFKRRHAGEMPESISFNLEQIYRLNGQLDEVNAKISVLEDRERNPESPVGSFRPQGSAGQNADDPWNRLSQLRAQLMQLRTRYSEKHPDVIKTRKEIQQLEAQLGGAGGQSGANAASARESELKKYIRQRDDLQRKIAEFTRRNQVAPLLGTEYSRLSTDYDNAMRQYNDARMKLSEKRVVKNLEEAQLGERVILIDPPVVPQQPERSQRGKILLAGFFLSLFCGLFASVVAENLDHSIKSAEQLQRITKLPVLTVMPLMGAGEKERNEAGATSAIAERLRAMILNPLSRNGKS